MTQVKHNRKPKKKRNFFRQVKWRFVGEVENQETNQESVDNMNKN